MQLQYFQLAFSAEQQSQFLDSNTGGNNAFSVATDK